MRALAETLTSRSKRLSKPRGAEVTPTPAPVEVALDSRDERRAEDSNRGIDQARQRRLALLRRAAARPRGRLANGLALLALVVVALFGISRAPGVPLFADRTLTDVVALASKSTSRAAAGFAFTFGGADREDASEAPHDAARAAKQQINREGHVSIPGGILVLPSTFVPDADGAYDLMIHFHGNTAVVKESAEVAKLNAAVAIVNLGIGSAPYEEYYAVPGTYEELLASVQRGLESRGVANAHLRRVALSGWSAGYGAISTILQVRKKTEDLDAILIFDGIHCGWEGGALNARQMHVWVDAAKSAANDEIYFGITHSSIDPRAYASTTATSSYLLDAVGATREPRDPAKDSPPYLELASMNGAIAKKLEKTMDPISEAHKGSFHVTGYVGELPEHHMEHLFQMGATLLPELVARWSR